MYKKIISKAPGRVCLFGDHQDYLGLPIIATTINNEIKLEATQNNDRKFKIIKKDLGSTDVIPIDFEYDSEINVIELYETELKRDERIMRYLNVSLDKDANNWAVKRRKKLKKDKA